MALSVSFIWRILENADCRKWFLTTLAGHCGIPASSKVGPDFCSEYIVICEPYCLGTRIEDDCKRHIEIAFEGICEPFCMKDLPRALRP